MGLRCGDGVSPPHFGSFWAQNFLLNFWVSKCVFWWILRSFHTVGEIGDGSTLIISRRGQGRITTNATVPKRAYFLLGIQDRPRSSIPLACDATTLYWRQVSKAVNNQCAWLQTYWSGASAGFNAMSTLVHNWRKVGPAFRSIQRPGGHQAGLCHAF